jgi:hypothetical protein
MSSNDEIGRLTKEVAALRQQLAELKQFLSVELRDDLPGKPSILHIRCATVTLCNAENPNQMQGMWSGRAPGPCLSLFGSDEKSRVLLQVEKDGPICRLFNPDLKPAVEISADDATGRGQVGVFEAGKPRAVMKASATGASVGVLNDGNHPRMFLHADAERGELIAVNADMKTSVKISSDGLSGGLLTVHGSNGKALVALSGAKLGGVVMVNNPRGKLVASLPAAGDTA